MNTNGMDAAAVLAYAAAKWPQALKSPVAVACRKITCECAACLAPERTLEQAFIAYVHTYGVQATPGFWTAYAQGYLAALQGRPTYDLTPYRCHAVDHDFRRGHADGLVNKKYQWHEAQS